MSALQVLAASRQLPSSRGGIDLLDDLSRLLSAVIFGDFDIERIIPLLKAVLGKEPDEVIWDKVYTAVTASIAFTVIAKPTTPPQSVPPPASSFPQIPWRFHTGSLANTSEPRKDVDPVLKSDQDSLRIDHLDVFTTFFEQLPQLHDVATAVF